MTSWLLIDCSLRTTAVLVDAATDGCRIVARGEARTTIDPEADVTLGVIAAVRQVEEISGRTLLQSSGAKGVLPRDRQGGGVDQVLVASSVGGGLQMMVAGLVRIMTAESAERAALGAGANVLDVLAIDDGRMPHERVQRMRELRPDLFLFSGGVDDGNQADVLEFAREIALANLPDTPVVYAGNVSAREQVKEILGARYQLSLVDNVRPVLESEVLEPTRQKLHELFMQHVVSKAPGFGKLGDWIARPIMPSTGATSRLIELIGESSGRNVLGVFVGDSTTDVFSVFDGRFTRTVTADIGLGRSIANVAVKAGLTQLSQWLPADVDSSQLMDYLHNRMLHPIEQGDAEDQLIEQAAAREAMRLALSEHRRRATGLRGVHLERDISDLFSQYSTGRSLVNLLALDLLIVSASVFRSADDRVIARVLLDGLRPEGITRLAIDEQMVAPHIGLLASVDAEAGYQVFMRDGLRHLGVAICPVGESEAGAPCLTIKLSAEGQTSASEDIAYGHLTFLPVAAGAEVTIQPQAGFDLGAGRGQLRTIRVEQTACGLIIDTRGRVQL